MIKQAELAYQATGKTVDRKALRSSLRASSMDIANLVEQRLFEATKYATEAGIAIYNAQVQAYAAYLDAYKTKVQIYTAQVQAEIARVEAFKAEVQAELAKAQINHELVEQYKAQVEAALSGGRDLQGADRGDPHQGRDREDQDRHFPRPGRGLRSQDQCLHRRCRGLPRPASGRGRQAGCLQEPG
jgi:hypothetical protein